MLAEITTLAGDLGVNISDLEIAHSAEGERGVLVLVVDADGSDASADGPGRPRLPLHGPEPRMTRAPSVMAAG